MSGEMEARERGRGAVAVAWHRVPLGFVSAYVLVRDGEAAVVDTGVPGSEDEIGRVLAAAGAGWSSVGHVILTHKHWDHVGSTEAVLERAPDAAVFAGEADIPAIASPRPITPVADGERVFDLEIVATPGHTPGHVCVLDREGGLLVAGDAVREQDGRVIGPHPEFTEDMETAVRSVAKLGSYPFDTVVVGHGDPVDGGAREQVVDLSERLASS